MLALTACGLGDVLLREGLMETALAEFRRASRLVKDTADVGRQRVLTRALAGDWVGACGAGRKLPRTRPVEEAAQGRGGCSHSADVALEGALGQLYYGLGAA